MSVRNRVTEKEPRTGALPAEQTAENAQQPQQGGNVEQVDKLVYQLVENNVNYAGEQFSENLKFNSEVLTNVLYDNIYKLLGEQFEQDKFVEWVADELLNSGSITQNTDVVYELDDTEYKKLVAQVDAAVELIKANRVTLFKLLNDVQQIVDEQVVAGDDQEKEETVAQTARSQQITNLVKKLQGNYQKLDSYFAIRQENITRIEETLDEAHERAVTGAKAKGGIQSSLNSTLDRIRGRAREVNQDYQTLGDKTFQKQVSKFDLFASQKGKYKELFGGNKARAGTKILKKSSVAKMKKKAMGGPSFGQKLKSSISNSKIFGIIKSISSIISKTLGIIKKVVSTVFKVGKKLVVGAYKTAKFAAKAFYKASKFVGKGVQKVASATMKFIKKAVKTGGKSVVKAIVNFSGAKLISGLGWKAIKFIGKGIWKGLKKLAMAAIGMLKKMFKLGGGFVNKVGTYIGKLSAGIMNKTYRFLVKPIANIMVTMVGFAFNVISSPIQFLKHMVPTLLEKVGTVVNNIKTAARSVLKSTWGLFKKILMNPLTIMLIVGGLLVFFGPKLTDWLSNGISGIVDTVVPAIVSFATKAVEFLTPVWECLKTFGGWLFEIIDWLTDPDNWVMKTIWWIIDKYRMIKGFIKNMMRAAGNSSVDILCMFISGDMIGVALHMIAGMIVKLWNYLKEKGAVKIMLKVIKTVAGLYKMIWEIPFRLVESVGGALWAIVKGNWLDVPKKFTQPWKEWWANICGIFQWDEEPKSADEILEHNPVEKNEEIAKETGSALKQLRMRGTDGSSAIQKMEEISRLKGYQNDKSMYTRIREMERLYMTNSEQVKAYDKFLTDVWKMTENANEESSQNALELLLSSPDFSQKILSVFFYYNPQTQTTMMTRPMSYIAQFIKNLQTLGMDETGDWGEKIKIFIEALEQLNMERSHIINNQGTQITNFAKNISNVNLKDQKNTQLLEQMVDEFNKGDLFSNMDAASSFNQMLRGNAKTQNLKSKTGRVLGSDNQLIKMNNNGTSVTSEDFKVKVGPAPVANRVVLPTSLNPPPALDSDIDESGRSASMVKKWNAYNAKMNELYKQGHTRAEVEEMGYKQLSYEEFRKRNISPEQLEIERKNKEKTKAGLRTALGVMKFNEKHGKVLGKTAAMSFKLEKGGRPNLYSIEANVEKDLYLFSDDWAMMTQENTLTDAELDLMADGTNEEAEKAIKQERQQRLADEYEAERQKKREQAILDYSAKVSGGFIEIKLGEDVVAMEDAYKDHCEAIVKFYKEGHTKKEAEERGLKQYTWEEWKRYYRKKNGMPEDGIKRIPFEGKKKERVIDWGPRPALSADELSKFGIEISPNGPVMVSIDKAMAAASQLLQGAKKIHSIRDGLEVMKMGLQSETAKLKKKREEGMPAAVVKPNAGGGETSMPAPANPSNYSDAAS